MAHSQLTQFSQFLQEATAHETSTGACIGRDCLYGVYTSWCLLARELPSSEEVFWAGMKKKRIRPGHTPLRIKGPAAADYILSTYPAMV